MVSGRGRVYSSASGSTLQENRLSLQVGSVLDQLCCWQAHSFKDCAIQRQSTAGKAGKEKMQNRRDLYRVSMMLLESVSSARAYKTKESAGNISSFMAEKRTLASFLLYLQIVFLQLALLPYPKRLSSISGVTALQLSALQ
jgi:hypothetical protein